MSCKSGIYIIKNTIDKRSYIGSSVNLINRKSKHFSNLKNKNHCNKKLLNFANKYGVNVLYFEVLEYVEDISKLVEREQYYIDSISPKFNILTVADSHLGRKPSIKTKQKISKSLKKRYKEDKILVERLSKLRKGRKATKEAKENMSKSRIGNKNILGRKPSLESRKRQSQSMRKYWKNKRNQHQNEVFDNNTNIQASK